MTCDHPRVRLIDGTETCTWSEGFRSECEARHVCSMPSLAQRREYMDLIKIKRGEKSWDTLRALVSIIWSSKQAQPAVARNTGS